MTIGSLFSGIGGLEMGLEMCGVGPVIWQAECDPYALAVLEHHWPDVRRYNDVREIDGSAARVDLVCGGFPCQPHSLAGKRRGTSDARWLWPEFARIIEAVRPAYVFIENVPGLRTSGLRNVLADLARLGFDAEWGLFSASEVGAPHLRRRLFILANANSEQERIQPWRASWANGTYSPVAGDDGADGDVADANRNAGQPRRSGDASEGGRRRHANTGTLGASVAHPAGECEREPINEADAGADRTRAREVSGGGSWWSTEPDVGRVANGVPARAHRLRLLGNAVVPAQAAQAFRRLLSIASSTREPIGDLKNQARWEASKR